MALVGKLEANVEIKAPADKFYNIFKSQNHHIPNICPDKIHAVEVHEGDWETAGSIKQWEYTIDGNVEVYKEKFHVDEENKSVTFVALQGHVLDICKSFTATFKVIPKDEGGLVHVTIDYEKLDEKMPTPEKYLQFLINVVKDVDAHLLKA